MKMVGQDREPQQINPEESGLTLEQFFDPRLAVIVVLAGDGIIAQQKSPPDNPIHDMHDGDLIGREDLNTG